MGDLKITGLTKRYDANAVVDDVSFTVGDGEFFVLLGPSGGGKSTLLRLICGLERPDAGRVTLAGRDITNLQPRERNIGMVFQDYGLYPHMNVSKNIAYGLEARRMPRREVEQRVAEAAEKLGLSSFLEMNVVDLSGGEQQRVALARALARDADLYLFDEPLSNLDPKLRARARGDIVLLHRSKQSPSVYVTHDQTEALAVADRIGVIAHGRMQQVGQADDLISRPANLFVASFIGSPPMNLLSATIRRQEGTCSLEADGIDLALPAEWQAALEGYGKDQVIAGIRPSAIGPTRADAASAVAAEIEDVEPLIGETVVTLKLGSGPRLAAVFDMDETASPGQQVLVRIDLSELRLFDPDTEQALSL